MWRYEVAYYDTDGLYRWKGFGKVDTFTRFLERILEKGFKIVGIVNMDGPEAKEEFTKKYMEV